MGVLWAGLLLAGAEAGSAAMAAVVLPVGVIAAVSGVRAVTDGLPDAGPRRVWMFVSPTLAIAVIPAILLPLAALGGPATAIGVAVVLAGGAVALLVVTSPRRRPYAVLLVSFGPAVAAASVVVARGQGLSEALTLLAAVCLYDMASFVTGTGPRGGPAGVLVGMITVGVLAVFVAAVVVPPYSGRTPWILLGLVAVLAPAGVLALGRIGGDRQLPALRRLDSLVLAGPAWVIAVGLLLHR